MFDCEIMQSVCIFVKNGSQLATPVNMGRRVGHPADPNDKQSGRRAGGLLIRTKNDKNVVRLGRRVGVALTSPKIELICESRPLEKLHILMLVQKMINGTHISLLL